MAKGAKGGGLKATHTIHNLLDGTHKPIPKGMEKEFIAQTDAWNSTHGYGPKKGRKRAGNDMVKR